MATADNSRALLQQANGLFRQGDLGGAIQGFRQVLQLQPADAATHYNLGLALHRDGRLEEAISSYQRALHFQPDLLLARNNLGAALKALGRLDEAVGCYRQILQWKPDLAEVHANLGNALLMQRKVDDAGAAFQMAVRIKPDHVEAWHNLGIIAHEQGKLDEAISHYQRVLELQPDYAAVHNKLGGAFQSRGNVQQAIWHWQKAVQFQPDFADAHNNLAYALLTQGKIEEAAAHGKEALWLQPDSATAHNNCGNALLSQGKPEEAAAHFERALELLPDFPEAQNNLGNALVRLGRLPEAASHLYRALRLRPQFAAAHNNLGSAEMYQGNLTAAASHFQQALRFGPDLPDAHKGLAILSLLQGEFRSGWAEFRWCWAEPSHVTPRHPQPLWDGSYLRGHTILLHANHGLGDSMQMIRYAVLLKQRGARVIVECPQSLLPLLSSAEGIDQWVPVGANLPSFDVQAPLLSLPSFFHSSCDTIPAAVPYLQADAALVERWRRELKQIGGFRVGIVWQGNPGFLGDRHRSIPVECFAPLAKVEGVRLVNLQKGQQSYQLSTISYRPNELDEMTGAFMDTAAIMQNLDLVISSDTSVVHLAGTLGIPVWVVLGLTPDWRWFLGREDSPWYPTARLFRQTRYGRWDDVIDRVAGELRRLHSRNPSDDQP